MDETGQLAPLCFVLMPFGRKMDAAGRVTNFDAVYETIIAPAVEQAGLEPIRADEEKIGGTIHKPMFERLMLCHYAVADITGANPNVFYELGIRHAMRPRSTVLVFAEGTVLPFDIALVRGLSYQTDGGGEPLEAEATRGAIAEPVDRGPGQFARRQPDLPTDRRSTALGGRSQQDRPLPQEPRLFQALQGAPQGGGARGRRRCGGDRGRTGARQPA
jgi:hypothetical protein